MLVLKAVFAFVMKTLSFLYSYRCSVRIKEIRNVIYTFWIKNFIGGVGEHVYIEYPIRLQGKYVNKVIIGSNTKIESHSIIGAWNNPIESEAIIRIGDDCTIGEYNHITSTNKITIGDGLLTGRFVIISDNNHGSLNKEGITVRPSKRPLMSKGEIIIGNNVWICDKASILSGVHIGDNVIVAANSVVLNDIPSNCVVAGIPAKIVKILE